MAVFVILNLLMLAFTPMPVVADEVWSDNFDDEVLDGWTLFGYEDDGTGSFLAETEGNFSAEGGELIVLDDDVNVARYNSTTSVGTWSFDMYIPDDDDGGIDVVFMSDGGRPGYDNPGPGTVFSGNWVALEAYTNVGSFFLWQAEEGNPASISSWDIEYHGWHYFNISRTSDGHFRVFHNGTLWMHRVPLYNVTSSEYLEVWFGNATGWAVDNIVVDDEPIPTTTTTTTTTPPTTNTTTTPPPPPIPFELIIIGGGIVVVAIVLVVVYARRR
jgi:hypothetical protein